MTHQRKTIRDAVVTILGNASIVGAGKVFSNRGIPIAVADLPAIVVYTLPEQSQDLDMTSATLRRTLDVNVELHATSQVDETLDDAIDAFSDSIETALRADNTWNGSATETTLKSTEWTHDDRGGDAAIGILRLKYSALYCY